MTTTKLEALLSKWLDLLNVSPLLASRISGWITILIMLAFSIGVFYLSTFVFKKIGANITKKTKNQIDDTIVETNFFRNISYIIPIIIMDNCVTAIISNHALKLVFIMKLIDISYVIVILSVFFSILNIWNILYIKKYKQGRSIKSIIQAIKIVLTIIGVVVGLSILINKSTSAILTTFGAASAVVMLVFKDTILGFVGSIQLATNRIVLLGDWITVPQFNADGNVIDISLISVKVQNWDNTITTIPTYSLISNPVINWRGMSDSGVRRMEKSIFIDQTSIKFCDAELLKRINSSELTKSVGDDFMKKEEGAFTNLSLFREYVLDFLKGHAMVDNNSTILVRPLQSSNYGLPIDIYAFLKTTDWTEYEQIQARILDYILASVNVFDLKVYQSPSGNDYINRKHN
ncbi:MAG: mechanosensitive ion channel [Bacteroidales bacterium]|nr:mechanosensitive ion channel [Bacteroidales bacterium]